jgi:hypothetical protein|tara:strand:- start:386 stop:538 length:153 start_codon:yes stop_codon:yes gene_type:complete
MSISGEIESCEELISSLRDDLDELYLLKMHKLGVLLRAKQRLEKLKGIDK